MKGETEGYLQDISQRVEEEKTGRDDEDEQQYGIMQQGKENIDKDKPKEFHEALVTYQQGRR